MVPAKIEHSIDTGAHRHGAGIIVRRPERTELLSHLCLHAVCLRIKICLALPEEPVHAVAYVRSHIQILEQCEIRKLDGEVVRHSVLELVHEPRLAELGSLEVDLVLDGGVVAKRELLVETLLPDPVLDLERIECRDGERDVRKGE